MCTICRKDHPGLCDREPDPKKEFTLEQWRIRNLRKIWPDFRKKTGSRKYHGLHLVDKE